MLHIQTWSGSRTARITEMTNAGKRGKTCRVLRFSGVPFDDCYATTKEQRDAVQITRDIGYEIEHLSDTADFDTVRALLLRKLVTFTAPDLPSMVQIYDEEIKGIDAPRETLTAGVPGKWSAGADEHGISLAQLDDVNQWREITSRQTHFAAYEIARKVWDRVLQAATLRDAAEILRGAGAKLHGYCGMD